MENASKALLIAGAILICILLIAIGMYIYNSAQETITTAASQMDQQSKNMYNATVSKYLGDSKSGSSVKQMIDAINTQNGQNVGESGKFIAIYQTNVKGFKDDADSGKLDEVAQAASVYIHDNGDNTQETVNNAKTTYESLKKAISANKKYDVTSEEKDGIIIKVTISEKAAKNP